MPFQYGFVCTTELWIKFHRIERLKMSDRCLLGWQQRFVDVAKCEIITTTRLVGGLPGLVLVICLQLQQHQQQQQQQQHHVTMQLSSQYRAMMYSVTLVQCPSLYHGIISDKTNNRAFLWHIFCTSKMPFHSHNSDLTVLTIGENVR